MPFVTGDQYLEVINANLNKIGRHNGSRSIFLIHPSEKKLLLPGTKQQTVYFCYHGHDTQFDSRNCVLSSNQFLVYKNLKIETLTSWCPPPDVTHSYGFRATTNLDTMIRYCSTLGHTVKFFVEDCWILCLDKKKYPKLHEIVEAVNKVKTMATAAAQSALVARLKGRAAEVTKQVHEKNNNLK